MAADYDVQRSQGIDDLDDEPLVLRPLRAEPEVAELDVDESELAESFELPGADLSGEELSVRVIPIQPDEFTCASCFLVQHRSRLARTGDTGLICRDCAG